MIVRRTERHLWDTLRGALSTSGYGREAATRFEVTTAEGVSDVEYVIGGWHGWIELKVSATARDESRLRFGSPFTAEQCTWLLAHHNPSRHLRSWLLIGMGTSFGTWHEFMLLPAPATPVLLRTTTTLATVHATRNVRRCDRIECILDWLVSSNGEGDSR